jgi:hypothetical protein
MCACQNIDRQLATILLKINSLQVPDGIVGGELTIPHILDDVIYYLCNKALKTVNFA